MMKPAAGLSKSPGPPVRARYGQSPPAVERKPSLTKVIATLKAAIEKLQMAQGLEAHKARQLSLDSCVGQVELLQVAFTSLADAVLQEMDSLVTERQAAQRERAAHSQRLQELEGRVQGKLGQLSCLEERLDVKLAVTAGLPGQVEALAAEQVAAQASVEGLRKDIKRLHLQLSQLENQQALAASEAAVAPLTAVQRTQVREYAAEQVQQQVPGMVANSVSTHVVPLVDEAVDASSRAVRADVAATTELLAADLARVSKEAAALRGSLSGVASGMQQQQHELGMLAPRVGRLEALESSTPRASLRLATALEAKVDNMAAQQARYTKSVEGVVSALVDDTVGLSKSARHLEGLVQHQQGQLQDTKEALLRSAKVFSHLLKVGNPVSSTLWSSGGSTLVGATSSPGRTSLAATAAAVAAANASLCGGGASPHASPLKAHGATAAAEGSPLRSKYASLLGSLM